MVSSIALHDLGARRHRTKSHRWPNAVRGAATAVLVALMALLALLASARHWRPGLSPTGTGLASRNTTATLTVGAPDRAATAPRRPRLTEPGEVIGGPIGHGPFAEGLHHTPRVLWLATGLILLAATLIGGAVVAASLDGLVARWLLGAAVPVGFLGVTLAVRNHIMSDVD